jgi:hypothetical protein
VLRDSSQVKRVMSHHSLRLTSEEGSYSTKWWRVHTEFLEPGVVICDTSILWLARLQLIHLFGSGITRGYSIALSRFDPRTASVASARAASSPDSSVSSRGRKVNPAVVTVGAQGPVVGGAAGHSGTCGCSR